MSAPASAKTDVPGAQPLNPAICNAEGPIDESVELRAQELWSLDGDHRWRMIVCVSGEVWITQERDLQDYVLEAGDVFIVNQRGSVLIGALDDASIAVTPSVEGKPYRGDYRFFH